MSISREEVLNIANLAKLEIKPEEVAIFQEQLSGIINFIDQLDEVQTDHIAPLTHINEAINVFREDIADNKIVQSEALQNAPVKDS